MEFEEALKILAALEREDVQYVLVGSVGMMIQGVVRATKDIAFFVDPSPENVARLRRALASIYDDPAIEEITAEDLGGDCPAVAYGPPNVNYSMDILARLGERFAYADLEWEEAIINGVKVRVATPRMLYRMKRDTVRPQDKVDAAKLKQEFKIEED